jgi:hypothetical protein
MAEESRYQLGIFKRKEEGCLLLASSRTLLPTQIKEKM